MEKKTINEMMEIYDIDVDEIIRKIRDEKAKNVLLQFPEGLKAYSTAFVDEMKPKLRDVNLVIWFDSCFGACDIPIESERLGIDLIIQFGHSKWGYKEKDIIELK